MKQKATLVRSIIAGLPGAEEGYTLAEFQKVLDAYDGIGEEELSAHLFAFLKDIIPAAEEAGVNMTIHPDDPPFPILGLPRVVSTERHAKALLDAVASNANRALFLHWFLRRTP